METPNHPAPLEPSAPLEIPEVTLDGHRPRAPGVPRMRSQTELNLELIPAYARFLKARNITNVRTPRAQSAESSCLSREHARPTTDTIPGSRPKEAKGGLTLATPKR